MAFCPFIPVELNIESSVGLMSLFKQIPVGQKLAWGNGPGYGTNTSHRAEGWGKLLAAAKCLLHLSRFTSIPYPSHSKVYSFSDKKGLITTLQRRTTKYSKPYANSTLQPDWLTEEIHSTYRQAGLPDIEYSWVKGHQDSTTLYHSLSIEAQYNVTADQLADAFMETNQRSRPLSPVTASSNCCLSIKGKTIHGHYTEAIRDAASLPELYGYLRHKHKWPKETLQTVAWPWFSNAAKTYHHTDNHLMKLVYDQLPARHAKCKKTGQSWIPDTCRICGVEPETFEHLLK
jgi:hypothetical protein